MKAQFIFCVAVFAVLAGCANRTTPVVDSAAKEAETFLREKAKYEPNVGKVYWLKIDTSACQVPQLLDAGCPSAGKGSKLQVDGIEQGPLGDAYYHINVEGGPAGYVSASGLIVRATDVDPMQTAAECIRRGQPRVGMTAKQVRATCWGEPDRVDRRETKRGVSERYMYGRSRHVLLHNGIVTSVQTSGTLR